MLCEDAGLVQSLRVLWPDTLVEWYVFESGVALLEKLFVDPPQMLITTIGTRDISGEEVVRTIKNENVYRQVRTVMFMDAETLRQSVNWHKLKVDDFIVLPEDMDIVRARLELVLHRSTYSLDVNPLTRLPGNASIIQTIEQYTLEDMDFAMAYADIDNFKSFNDRYGFARGDEVILMTARAIVTTVSNCDASPHFVGHIGGDAFIFILPESAIISACEEILSVYEAIVPSFYDEEDMRRSYIESIDRQGNAQRFPFISLSIAVVINKNQRFKHFSEISHVAGQLKSVVKAKPGNTYVIDRRSR